MKIDNYANKHVTYVTISYIKYSSKPKVLES